MSGYTAVLFNNNFLSHWLVKGDPFFNKLNWRNLMPRCKAGISIRRHKEASCRKALKKE